MPGWLEELSTQGTDGCSNEVLIHRTSSWVSFNRTPSCSGSGLILGSAGGEHSELGRQERQGRLVWGGCSHSRIKHPRVGKVNWKDFILFPQTPHIKHMFVPRQSSARLWSHPEGQEE